MACCNDRQRWASLSTFVGPAIDSWPVFLLFTLGSAVIIFLIYRRPRTVTDGATMPLINPGMASSWL